MCEGFLTLTSSFAISCVRAGIRACVPACVSRFAVTHITKGGRERSRGSEDSISARRGLAVNAARLGKPRVHNRVSILSEYPNILLYDQSYSYVKYNSSIKRREESLVLSSFFKENIFLRLHYYAIRNYIIIIV